MKSTLYIPEPQFCIEIPAPRTIVVINVISKGDYFKLMNNIKDPDIVKEILVANCVDEDLPPLTPLMVTTLAERYIEALRAYKEENMDFLSVPESLDTGKNKVRTKFPMLSSGDNLVYKHTGLNFYEQLDLPITEYWLLLADAVKQRLLESPSGIEYLEECYNYMHKISTIKPNVKK